MNSTTLDTGKNQISESSLKVLSNTYKLLAMNLFTSALCAFAAMTYGVPPVSPLLFIGGYFALLFGVSVTSRSAMGLPMTFLLTGFLGYTMGPVLNSFLALPNGAGLVAQSLIATSVIFIAISVYTIKTKKVLSNNMTSFLAIGMLVLFVMGLLNVFFFQSGILSLALSSMVVFISSGIIMWQISDIVNDGEDNYILATVTLFVQLFNLFMNILNILGFLSGDD